MKVKMLSRNPDDYVRETKRDIHKGIANFHGGNDRITVQRNYDPVLHPFEAPREYTRAMNAVKLERVFAKPFIGSLDGHRDGVQCMIKHPTSLSKLLTGACDGEIRLWNLPKQNCELTIAAHEGFVRGLAFHPSGEHFYSCGEDMTIKQWNTNYPSKTNNVYTPNSTIVGKNAFNSISHHRTDNKFVTAGCVVNIWDSERSDPIRTFHWGVDTVTSIKFNQIETEILAGCASDRSIILYDMRASNPLRKVVLKLRSNTIAWNPMEPFIFTAANEDYNLYTFDTRRLSKPLNIHTDHVSAVMDVDYSPTGKQFVSGGYDKTVRIYDSDNMHSKDVYHTKRMQRVLNVQWTLDNKFILSASDEMNVRMWKADASSKLGILKPREKEAFNYNEKLKEKYASHPKIRRIRNHRHVPKAIQAAANEHKEIHKSKKRKETNRNIYTKPEDIKLTKTKDKNVMGQIK